LAKQKQRQGERERERERERENDVSEGEKETEREREREREVRGNRSIFQYVRYTFKHNVHIVEDKAVPRQVTIRFHNANVEHLRFIPHPIFKLLDHIDLKHNFLAQKCRDQPVHELR